MQFVPEACLLEGRLLGSPSLRGGGRDPILWDGVIAAFLTNRRTVQPTMLWRKNTPEKGTLTSISFMVFQECKVVFEKVKMGCRG